MTWAWSLLRKAVLNSESINSLEFKCEQSNLLFDPRGEKNSPTSPQFLRLPCLLNPGFCLPSPSPPPAISYSSSSLPLSLSIRLPVFCLSFLLFLLYSIHFLLYMYLRSDLHWRKRRIWLMEAKEMSLSADMQTSTTTPHSPSLTIWALEGWQGDIRISLITNMSYHFFMSHILKKFKACSGFVQIWSTQLS